MKTRSLKKKKRATTNILPLFHYALFPSFYSWRLYFLKLPILIWHYTLALLKRKSFRRRSACLWPATEGVPLVFYQCQVNLALDSLSFLSRSRKSLEERKLCTLENQKKGKFLRDFEAVHFPIRFIMVKDFPFNDSWSNIYKNWEERGMSLASGLLKKGLNQAGHGVNRFIISVDFLWTFFHCWSSRETH